MAGAFIVAAGRTAGGRRNGALAGWHPVEMAAEVLNALVDRSGIDPSVIDDVIMGCVSQVGEQSFHVGRNAVLASRLPQTVPAVTIDRQCGSSQQSLHFAAQAVMSGTQDVVVAAGVESMTRVPMFTATTLPAREGLGTPYADPVKARFGVEEFSQFQGAEMMAEKYGFDRDALDAFALESHRKASEATDARAFDAEIIPLQVNDAEGVSRVHFQDEGIRRDASLATIGAVRLLREGGRISAANSSQICDGSAGLLVVSERALKRYDLTPIARIHSMAVAAGDPVLMLEEPIPATRKVLSLGGLSINEIDFYEVNEAFASVPLAWLQAIGADPARLNVNGGAIALGHPLGASGAKLMATLIHVLKASGGRYGLQTICEGGGMANAIIIEAL